MKIIKGDTKIDIPMWIVMIGIDGLIDIIQIIANVAATKKSNK